MKCFINLPESGQRFAVPASCITTHTTPEQRTALLEQLARLRCYVYHVADIAARSKAPNGARFAQRSKDALEEMIGLMHGALFAEMADEYEATQTPGGRA